jgi:hypothetical protein
MKNQQVIKKWSSENMITLDFCLSTLFDEHYIIDSVISTKYWSEDTLGFPVIKITEAIIICHKEEPDFGKC